MKPHICCPAKIRSLRFTCDNTGESGILHFESGYETIPYILYDYLSRLEETDHNILREYPDPTKIEII